MIMPERTRILRIAQRGALGLAVLAGLGAWIGWLRSDASATPPPSAAPAPVPAPAAQPAAATDPTAAPAGAAVESDSAQIVFTTSPAVTATVTWGTTRLGRIRPGAPLVVVRPRDSGPLDVVVRAPGFMPVHTRANTFADTKMHVKLTRPEEKSTLIGYRAPIDAGVPLDDGGIPPAISGMPPSLADPPFSPLLPPAVTPPAVTPATPPAVTPATPPAPTNTVPPALAR
jgi:hypothetical protein